MTTIPYTCFYISIPLIFSIHTHVIVAITICITWCLLSSLSFVQFSIFHLTLYYKYDVTQPLQTIISNGCIICS